MKKLLSVLLALSMMLTFLTVTATADDTGGGVIAAGTCGEGLTWSLDDGGTLTISGSGAMDNYLERSPAPWDSVSSQVRALVLSPEMTSIGDYAFAFCVHMTGLVVPDSVTEIGDAAFCFCDDLVSADLGNGVTTLGSEVFSGCERLTTVKLPDCLTTIGAEAFSCCRSLTGIALPDGITEIAARTFYDCEGMCRLTLGSGVTEISDSAFSSCRSLTEVVLPEQVTRIGENAFQNCTGLTSVTIPAGVTEVGSSAFYWCRSLEKVVISDLAAWCGIRFADCFANPLYWSRKLYLGETHITELVIPESVTAIGAYAFTDCSSLTSVTIPESVTGVGRWAFEAAGITDVYFAGSSKQWSAIEMACWEIGLDSAAFHFNCRLESPFTDVRNSDAFYYVPVVWATEQQITSGTSAQCFSPYDACTRAQVITFLYRLAGEPAVSGAENPFTDVTAGDYFYPAVLWGCLNGIVYGVTDTTFCPNETVTRAQFVTFLWRYAGAPEAVNGVSRFVDLPEDTYYTAAVKWGKKCGVIAGLDSTHFAPDSPCTRAQVVTFLYRYAGEA